MPQVKTKKASGKYVSNFPFSFSTSSVIPYFWREDKTQISVLFVKRKNEPFKGMLALAGGFQEPGKESLVQTAARELAEETHIVKPIGEFILVCEQSEPDRDPRGAIIDHVYSVEITPEDLLAAHSGDDAAALEMVTFTAHELSEALFSQEKKEMFLKSFAFDHGISLLEFWSVVE